jgi:predicted dienelactone hydrolase
MRKLFLALILIPWVVAFVRAEETVGTLTADWHDSKRNVDVPVKVYFPKDIKSPAPVVIISHGLGGSREGLKYLGEYLAAHGYVTVHPTHVGSDTSLLKRDGGSFGKAIRDAMNPTQLANRVNDVSFCIDEMEHLNADAKSQFYGKLDLKRVAMAGHSFGAITTEAVCGAGMARGTLPAPDSRIKCGVALSPSPPRAGDAKAAFATVKLPMLHLTGTEDDMSQFGAAGPADRRVPFDLTNGNDQCLVILKGATHMTLGGGERRSLRSDGQMTQILQRMTLEFLNAYDRDDAAAKTWLQKDAKAFVGEHGTYEMKLAPAR